MANLDYKQYAGYGTTALKDLNYSQSVRIGDYVHAAGQGGWDPRSEAHPPFPGDTGTDEHFQIDQAFKNVDLALSECGASIQDVFKYTSYHPNLSEDTLKWMAAAVKRTWPDRDGPLWTCIGVDKLAWPEMLVEIDVMAYSPNKENK